MSEIFKDTKTECVLSIRNKVVEIMEVTMILKFLYHKSYMIMKNLQHHIKVLFYVKLSIMTVHYPSISQTANQPNSYIT